MNNQKIIADIISELGKDKDSFLADDKLLKVIGS